ncbi:MAG: glycosyltransferase family 2 protein [Frankia sp.]|nr:glycosyltransferase family 2 protein [Frankia sp.]
MAEPRATVIVLNYNGEALIGDCLRALAAQDVAAGDAETWVVDNASRDTSADLVAREFPDVRLIRNPRNDGFAGGNNVALREVATPYAVLLNNDARPARDWLRRLLAAFDEPGTERLGATTSKVVFLPRFVPLEICTTGFRPPADGRDLGVQIGRVEVVRDGDALDVTESCLWEKVAYAPEGYGEGRFRWTRPTGPLLVPVDADGGRGRRRATTLRIHAWAERPKALRVSWPRGAVDLQVGTTATAYDVAVPATVALVDVVNNVGGIVYADGYGADRGYQEVDAGQHDDACDVFGVSGAAAAFRTDALRDVGYFDDDFFLYYEDTDLSWRLRSRGWDVRYVPDAIARHIHSATSEEWSPLFTFHVDRNRLLMLTKNATRDLALRAVGRYPLTAGSIFVRGLRQWLRTRQRPPLRATALRLRVMASYLRLLPAMLRKRRQLARRAVVPARELQERWLVAR